MSSEDEKAGEVIQIGIGPVTGKLIITRDRRQVRQAAVPAKRIVMLASEQNETLTDLMRKVRRSVDG